MSPRRGQSGTKSLSASLQDCRVASGTARISASVKFTQHKAADSSDNGGRLRPETSRSCRGLRPGTTRSATTTVEPGQERMIMGDWLRTLALASRACSNSRSRMRVFVLRVEIARRLVGDHEARTRDQQARQMATRCCSPWLRAPGCCSSLSLEPAGPGFRASARARTSASSDSADVIRIGIAGCFHAQHCR